MGLAMKKEDLVALVKEVAGAEFAERMEENRKKSETDNPDSVLVPKEVMALLRQQKDQPQIAKAGERIGGCIRYFMRAKGDGHRAIELAEKDNNELIHKSLVAGIGEDGGFTVTEDVLTDFIEFLRPESVVGSSNPMVIDMPNGNATMNGFSSGAVTGYIGEQQNIPTTQQAFRQVKLTAKKLASIIPISNDLVRFGSANNDAVIRNDLVASVAERQDIAALRGDGLQDTPLGMRNLLNATTNEIAASGTINLQNTYFDLGNLVLALKGGNIKMRRPVWFISPRTEQFLMTINDGNGNAVFRAEMIAGTLWGMPFKVTNNIPETLGAGSDESEIYLADMAEFIWGNAMSTTISVSTEASYTVQGTVLNAFQRDETLLRVIDQHDFNIRHDRSVAVLTGVKWAPVGA